MLAAQRYAKIIQLLNHKQSVSVAELSKLLQASEATVRRDINVLHTKGSLIKVYGGAMSAEDYTTTEDKVEIRKTVHVSEKELIAITAAKLIKAKDIVYIDAGTTTELLLKYLQEKDAVYITNDASHAVQLISHGFTTTIIGGTMKLVTYATVGASAVENLRRYNFTIGFFGTNGVSIKAGLTTPTDEEAMMKETAINHCKKAYILADNSKFGKITPFSFSSLDKVTVITNKQPDETFAHDVIVVAG